MGIKTPVKAAVPRMAQPTVPVGPAVSRGITTVGTSGGLSAHGGLYKE